MKPLTFSLILLLFACSSGRQMGMQMGKMIVPGVGTDELHVGMRKGEIIDLLGEPEAVGDQGRWLDYRKNFGLDFLLGDGERVAEVRFSQGFRGRLPSRVKVGSRMQAVFDAYGTPTERQEVPGEAVGTGDRVLYRTPEAYKISYNRLGLSFWFSSQKRITRIVVFKPLPDRNIRIKPQQTGSYQVAQ